MMKHIGDIAKNKRRMKNFIFSLCFALPIIFLSQLSYANMPAFGGISCGYTDNRIDTTFEIFDYDTDAQKKSKEAAKQALNNVNNYCNKLKKIFENEEDSIEHNNGVLGFGGDTEAEFKKKFDAFLQKHPSVNKEYSRLLSEFQSAKRNYDRTEEENKKDIEEGIASGKYIACGEKHPRGCRNGQSCYQYIPTGSSVHVGPGGAGATVHNLSSYECFVPGKEKKDYYLAEKGSGNKGSSHTTIGTGYTQTISSDAAGNVTVDESYMGKEVPKVEDNGDNSVCKVAEMEKKYQSSCYSCIVVKTLLEKFINACTKVSDLCRRAAVQILLVATLLWVAFWALKTISSVASLEPSSIVNTLLIQAFKIMFAYVVIESGIEVFMIHVVSPILVAGADFGTAILANSQSQLSMTPSPDYTYSGVELLSADMLNKIMGFNESLDRVVSTNLVIGHALTCHSVNAGAWVNHSIMDFQIIIPNVWIWLCGAAIWFAGFMLVLAVSYYLLDISFKIGIAIMIFPLLMALWPFSMTAGKVKTCVKTMLSSAAIFAFLAITTSYAMAMISVTLRDVPELFERVEKGDSKWISETFDITGPYFILILFAYLYSIKLVRSTVDDYVNKFFGGGLMANASPMHSEMTRMTDIAKKATVGAGKAAVGAATGGAGKVLGAVAGATVGKAAKFVKDKFTKSDKEQGKNNKSPNAGTAVKQSGKAIKQSGKAVEQSGKAVEMAGKGVDKAGQGIAHGGKGIMNAGAGLSSTGLGAIIGVPMMIAGAAVYAGGAAVQAGGKATVAAGKAVKASGKVMKKSGEMIEKAGRSMEKFGRKLKFGKDADKQDKQKNQENSGQAE